MRVSHTDEFQEQLDSLVPQYPRLQDALSGIEWALLNDAESVGFPIIKGPAGYIRAVAIDPFPGVPDAVFYFRLYEGQLAELYAIRDSRGNDLGDV